MTLDFDYITTDFVSNRDLGDEQLILPPIPNYKNHRGVWCEWQSLAYKSPWRVVRFTYRDLSTREVREAYDIGGDYDFAGGFYPADEDRYDSDRLLGIDLQSGLVWMGMMVIDRGGDPVFDGEILQGHLIEVMLREYRSGRYDGLKMRCDYRSYK